MDLPCVAQAEHGHYVDRAIDDWNWARRQMLLGKLGRPFGNWSVPNFHSVAAKFTAF